MDSTPNDLAPLVHAVVRRVARQQEHEVTDAAAAEFSRRMAAVVATCTLPAPLPPGEVGRPGGVAEAELTRLVAAVLPPNADPFLAEVARQLFKACLYPEFTQCRDSYRERATDGRCRRQERDRTRLRVSGAPCVDCPYWMTLAAEDHGRLLDAGWVGDPAVWRAESELYLPEDFRALRRWVRRRAATAVTGKQ